MVATETEAHTVSMRAVRILRDCFLVSEILRLVFFYVFETMSKPATFIVPDTMEEKHTQFMGLPSPVLLTNLLAGRENQNLGRLTTIDLTIPMYACLHIREWATTQGSPWTCSNLLNLDLTIQKPPTQRSAGKQVVGNQLKGPSRVMNFLMVKFCSGI